MKGDFEDRLDIIIKNQLEFQRIAELPVNSGDINTQISLIEGFIGKGIEEFVELRKTMPSAFNRFEKNPAPIDWKRTREELVDVFLFWVNILNECGFTFEEILVTTRYIQAANFTKIREKIVKRRNQEKQDATQPKIF